MIEEIKLKSGEYILFTSKFIKSIDKIVEGHIKRNNITDEEREYHKNYIPQKGKDINLNAFFQYHDIGNKLNYEEYLTNLGQENKLKKPQYIASMNKIIYLIHTIARNSFIRKDDPTKTPLIKLSSEILQEVIGKDYDKIVNTLTDANVLTIIKKNYKIGESVRIYGVNRKFYYQIECKKENNKKIKEYIDKTLVVLNKKYNSSLFTHYNKCLSKVKLTDNNNAIHFINDKIDNIKNRNISDDEKDYNISHYDRLLKQFLYCTGDNYVRLSIDKNNRIYHILTNANREFRKFVNIKFMIDICNSHPLLFNKFLLEYYNINNDIYNIINNIIYNKDTHSFHYYDFRHKSLKSLISKIIRQSKFANMDLHKDVIHYLTLTSKGKLWYYLLDKCKEEGLDIIDGVIIDKYQLKEMMFAQVFYANIHELSFTIATGEKVIKHYARLFKKLFPNVFKVINHNKPKGNEKEFSNNLMKLEAEIFYQILEKLYKKRGLDCISIHDAIVVLNTSDKKYNKEDIEKVMLKVYHSYSLYPSLDFTDYSLMNT